MGSITQKVPPKKPSTVFLGLISGQSLCFPMVTPVKYARVSEINAPTTMNHIKIFPKGRRCTLVTKEKKYGM